MEKTTQSQTETAPAPEETAEQQRQLREIRMLDPTVETLADVLHMETAEEFRRYVRMGLDWKDAFLLANRERLLLNAEERDSLRRRKAGKEHLQASSTRGEGASSVPSAELRLYRELMPELSEAEIRRHYNTDRKKVRG